MEKGKEVLCRGQLKKQNRQVDRTVGCFVNKLSARRQAKFSSSPLLAEL